MFVYQQGIQTQRADLRWLPFLGPVPVQCLSSCHGGSTPPPPPTIFLSQYMKPFIVSSSYWLKVCALYHSSGFVHGEAGAEPRLMQFHPHFQHGALLTVVSAFAIYHHTLSEFCIPSCDDWMSESGCLSVSLPVLVQWKNLPFAFLFCECRSCST